MGVATNSRRQPRINNADQLRLLVTRQLESLDFSNFATKKDVECVIQLLSLAALRKSVGFKQLQHILGYIIVTSFTNYIYTY